jgi:xylulose-5-phosphate/fructose-6-phosphate phosphoketolase
MALQPPSEHPHGLPDEEFDHDFSAQDADRFCVPWLSGGDSPAHISAAQPREPARARLYKEEGTTTTPFDMCVLNNIDRFQLALDAIKRVPRMAAQVDAAEQWYSEAIQRHKLYVAENGDDLPEIKDWRWSKS